VQRIPYGCAYPDPLDFGGFFETQRRAITPAPGI
jgi:hypothetical protein